MSCIDSGALPEVTTRAHVDTVTNAAIRRTVAKLFITEGFGIIPLLPCDKKPLPGGHAYKDAFTDKESVDAVFADGSDRNLGVNPPAEVFALDVDPRNGGNTSMQALLDDVGPLPETVTVCTGSGGSHRYFRLPDGVTSDQLSGRIAGLQGIDIKTKMGYLVGPGSIHPNGMPYTFEEGHAIGEIPIATAPAALIDRLVRPASTSVPLSGRSEREGLPRRNASLANFSSIEVGCKWVQHCRTDATSISEPEWVALAMILNCCSEGQGTFHDLSKLDMARYDYRSCEEKFDHVRRSEYSPPRCSTIHDQYAFDGCKSCVFFGTLNSPIGLGYEDKKVVELQKRYIYASGVERYYDISSTSNTVLATKGFNDHYAHLGLESSAHKTMMGSTRSC